VFELKDIDNQWKSYDDIKGEKLTIIDFWATWCQPCLRSIPELNTLFEEMAPRGVNFVGISVDGPRNQSKLKPFTNSLGVSYPILRDVNSEVMSDMNVTSVPTLLLYDADGTLLFLHEGFRPGDTELLREEIEKHL
jgi:thiol-disulfide isomerase/thioredoxin